MSIRFRKYTNGLHTFDAIKITEKNVADIVEYINKNNGTAVDETKVFYDDKFKDGVYSAVKMAVVQENIQEHPGRVYKAVRKAYGGDLIVRTETVVDGKKKYKFHRVRDNGINGYRLAK